MSAILIRQEERDALHELRDRAARVPVDMRTLAARLATPEGKEAHRRQMTAQTFEIPVRNLVTFSVEIGHPNGAAARHMSMSSGGNLPAVEAVLLVAEELGFVGGVESWTRSWPENLQGHGRAVNVVQIISAGEVGRA